MAVSDLQDFAAQWQHIVSRKQLFKVQIAVLGGVGSELFRIFEYVAAINERLDVLHFNAGH